MITAYFKKLNEEAVIPKQAYPTDAGIDFFSDIEIYSASSIIKVPTGVAWEPEIEFDYNDYTTSFFHKNFNIYMQITDKSGFSTRTGLHVIGGVIDQNYRGEIIVCLRNDPMNTIHIKKGEKMAQGIVKVVPIVKIIEVNELKDSDRGENGFGSTG